ncbi:MAG: CPBP family intramembrane glutamic endopeptidase [Paludibacter sp.]|nr:CPBP family intramembrane glutamic endopeptidase [Paludibacter sp.]
MKLSGLFESAGVGAKTLQLIALTFVSALFFSLISILITGNDLSEINALKTAQLFQSVGIFVFPPLILAFIWSEKPFELLRINRKPDFRSTLYAIIIMVVAIPAINLLGEINHLVKFPESLSMIEDYLIEMEKRAENITNAMLSVRSIPDLLINIGLIAVIPAVGEELFFRGTIQRLLQDRMKIHAAVWITAFIFSSIHFQFYGFIPRLLMGAFLGYLFAWTNNLWVPILAHFTNNALAVVFYFLKNTGQTTVDLENVGKSETYLIGIISVIVVAVLIPLFKPQKKITS